MNPLQLRLPSLQGSCRRAAPEAAALQEEFRGPSGMQHSPELHGLDVLLPEPLQLGTQGLVSVLHGNPVGFRRLRLWNFKSSTEDGCYSSLGHKLLDRNLCTLLAILELDSFLKGVWSDSKPAGKPESYTLQVKRKKNVLDKNSICNSGIPFY